MVDEAILDENGSNDDDDKIVARLTPRVPSLVARGGKHSRHSRHPLSVPPTTTSGDVHSTTLLTFLIVVLPGRPLNREISARVESKRDIVLRRNSNGCNPWKKEIHRREFITFSSPFRPIRYRIYVIESNRPSLRFQTPPPPPIFPFDYKLYSIQIHPSFSKRFPFNNIGIDLVLGFFRHFSTIIIRFECHNAREYLKDAQKTRDGQSLATILK